MVWGSPDLLADVGNGILTLQNLHFHRYGQGLKLSKGTLKAFNLSFNQEGRHLDASDDGDAQLVGLITTGLLQTHGASPAHVIECPAKWR